MKTETIWLIGIIAIVLLIVGVSKGIINLPEMPTFNIVTTTVSAGTVEHIDTAPASPECNLESDKARYCVGDWATVTLDGEPSTAYAVYINKDNTGWLLWGNRATDYQGHAEQGGYLNDPGHYQIRALSLTCYSNVLEVDVIICGENCWWQSIAKEDVTLNSGLFSNWHGTLVDGKFKFEWSYEKNGVDTEISHDAIMQYTSSSRTGDYEFNANNGETWQISALNYLPVSSDIHLELYQWVCEGDDLNWNPNMYGSMGELSQEEMDNRCNIYCQEQESALSGWFAGSPDDCTAQMGTYIEANGCCCYNSIM